MSTIPPIQSAVLNLESAKSDCHSAINAWEDSNWADATMWINNSIAQLEAARAKICFESANIAGEALFDKPQQPQPEQAKEEQVFYALKGQELLDEDIDDIVSRLLDNYRQRPGESFDVLADRIPWPVKVFKFRRVKVSESYKNSLATSALEGVLESLDENYSDPGGDYTEATAQMQLAARRFVDEIVRHYTVWNCEPTEEVVEVTREQAKEIAG